MSAEELSSEKDFKCVLLLFKNVFFSITQCYELDFVQRRHFSLFIFILILDIRELKARVAATVVESQKHTERCPSQSKCSVQAQRNAAQGRTVAAH